MNVLVCGADGFLGHHIVEALLAAGHRVLRGVHTPRMSGDVAMDYHRDLTVADWLPRLAGVDAVVNAVGILHERRRGDFDRVHRRAPEALFEACVQAGIQRVVQLSALGKGGTSFLDSKHSADRCLWRLLPQGVVVRPGLVFGPEGTSTRFFLALASLPTWGRLLGTGPIQPVHVADLTGCVTRLVEGAKVNMGLLELPGPERLSFDELLARYRHAMGFPPAHLIPIPALLMTLSASLTGWFPGNLLSPATWAMLRAGNTGDPSQAAALLGRPLSPPADFISPAMSRELRLQSLAAWRRPVAKAVLAMIWLGSALISAGLHQLDDSLARLAPFGLEGMPALATLVAATGLDLLLGLLTLLRPGRRLWETQLAVIAIYTGLVAWRLPAYLFDPFGPILKNLAVMALLLQLWSEEEKP